MAGLGLGLSGTAIGVGILTGARHEEADMISGAGATGHELGGTLEIAIYASIATAAAAESAARQGTWSRPPRLRPNSG